MERVLGTGSSFLCAMDSGSPHDMKGMFGSVSQLDDDGLSGGSTLITTPTRMLWRCLIARAEPAQGHQHYDHRETFRIVTS